MREMRTEIVYEASVDMSMLGLCGACVYAYIIRMLNSVWLVHVKVREASTGDLRLVWRG